MRRKLWFLLLIYGLGPSIRALGYLTVLVCWGFGVWCSGVATLATWLSEEEDRIC